MGVNDYGPATSSLDAPPLGGPGGWAESVAEVLNESDETVDSRIAAATADLGARITRPNIDDRLVEQWNGSAWSVVDYDSGWRDITGLLVDNGETSLLVKMRRLNATVHLAYALTQASTATQQMLGSALPSGFRAGEQTAAALNRAGWSTPASPHGQVVPYASGIYYRVATASDVAGISAHVTNDAVPTSLPGTLVTPAPQ